jgi:CDGSH-type Zn-finger protein
MSQEIYKQLRVEFQKLREQYEQNKGPKFSIQICAPSHWNTADPPYDTEKFEPVTTVCLPFEDGYMPNPIQNEEVSLFGFALVPKAKKTKQACTRFVELGGTAGLHLPGQITHQLKGLSSDLLDDPLSKWLALLIVLNGNHSGNSVIVRPFLNSIEAIDRCGLTEDKPFCFESVSVVEDASKKPPGRPKSSYEVIQKEAALKEKWIRAKASGIRKVVFAKDNGYKSQKEFEDLLQRVYRRNKKTN